MAGAIQTLIVFAIGFGIITAYMAFLTWLDNRSGRKDSDDAPSHKK